MRSVRAALKTIEAEHSSLAELTPPTGRRLQKRSTFQEAADYHRVMVDSAAAAPLVCQICKQPKSPQNGTIGEVVRPSLSAFIKKKDPQWDGKGFICFDDLGKFRRDYVKEVLEDEIGELSALDQEVVESLQAHEILSSDIRSSSRRNSPLAGGFPTGSRPSVGAGLSSSSSASSCCSGSWRTASSWRRDPSIHTRTS
jgi:hypothetical protein